MGNTYEAWIEESKARYEKALKGFEKIGTLRDLACGKVKDAFLYVQAQDRGMLPISYVNGDWWAVTGTGWNQAHWCCTPDTFVYGKVAA